MEIRSAEPTDAAAIAAIMNAHIPTRTIEWRDDPHTEADVRDWLDAHTTTLVAVEAGELVGVAAYGPFRDWEVRPGYRLTVENSVHVRESHWGRGVGRVLMEALIDDARAGGKHVMVAAIDGENTGSVDFHARLGFEHVGRMPEIGAKFGRWLDLVLMQLLLDDRTAPPTT